MDTARRIELNREEESQRGCKYFCGTNDDRVKSDIWFLDSDWILVETVYVVQSVFQDSVEWLGVGQMVQ